MVGVARTQNLFVRFICVIYLFAFLSFYIQIPGLYGNRGILPARTYLADSGGKTLSEKIHNKPTLLWFAPFLGLNTEYMMDVLALTGIFLSFTGFVSQKFCIAFLFAALWSLYYSLYQVGQIFMWFQWDTLLLEVGFICILCAPFQISRNYGKFVHLHQDVSFFLVKWLFFRFMFASGVVKLQSGCPTWWGLTALEVHFESQPLPTPLAWYFHHLPNWLLKLGSVYTHVVEQNLPFLFFFPVRSVRITGFIFQLILQLGIIMTGNYNFFNLLTICLSLSLLDDKFFHTARKDKKSLCTRLLSIFFNLCIHGFVLSLAIINYSIRLHPNGTVSSSIAFTKAEFDHFLKTAVPASIYIGGITLLITSIFAISRCFKQKRNKIRTLIVTLIYISAAFFMFGISLVPHSLLHKSSNTTIMPSLRKIYSRIDHLQIANSYGLFRRMTGVGGRPEVVIEGSNDIKGPWINYNFKYKPTDVNSSLSFVFPYQPRLDWQMWFASLGTYHQNPWLMSLAYRMLNGEKDVMKLLSNHQKFEKPPKYLKASLYHYHYTPWSKKDSPTWWTSEKVGEYFPIFTKGHAPLVEYLKSVKILESNENITDDDGKVRPWMKLVLDSLRNTVAQLDPFIFMWSVFIAGCIIVWTHETVPLFSSQNSKNYLKTTKYFLKAQTNVKN